MTVQHCGRPDDHEKHEHLARPRPAVSSCVCTARVCCCPVPEGPGAVRLRVFICTGKLVKEGAPAHLPVRVEA